MELALAETTLLALFWVGRRTYRSGFAAVIHGHANLPARERRQTLCPGSLPRY
jgi:hypothetical protein